MHVLLKDVNNMKGAIIWRQHYIATSKEYLTTSHILSKYFELVFLQLHLVKISCKLIWLNYERKKEGAFFNETPCIDRDKKKTVRYQFDLINRCPTYREKKSYNFSLAEHGGLVETCTLQSLSVDVHPSFKQQSIQHTRINTYISRTSWFHLSLHYITYMNTKHYLINQFSRRPTEKQQYQIRPSI